MSDSSLKIYCRVRPLDDQSEFNCVVQRDEHSLTFVPFDGSRISNRSKEICYSFEHVFGDRTIQKEIFDHVAYPLVNKLLQGKDGLILTHGLTSSGKTYTMTGTPEDEGLIPRSIDVIFNTIEEHQAPKFMFKSNNENGFVVQSVPEALIDQQKNMGLFSKTSTPKRTESIGDWSDRVSDSYIVDSISSHRKYAVFLSYIEIYNNYIYDLLEEIPEERKYKNSASKMLDEDRDHNMYVRGLVESEVKSADEALGIFCTGQLRRKFSHTSINAESSRSHTVFTIRLVQAPVSPYASEIEQSQSKMLVSQLSFVDLASCERIMEMQNGTRKLNEIGSKNATLAALNSCIEAVKKSPYGKDSKTIPYRKSKLTHLFKSFFKGKGEIRMIVCLNPRLDDCIKTAKFLKFAKTTETSQSDISEVSRKLPRKLGSGDTYQKLIKQAHQQEMKITKIHPVPDIDSIDIELPPITTEINDESSYTNLIEVLKKRKLKRLSLEKDLLKRQNEFRNNLISVERENSQLNEDKKHLEMDLRAREQQLQGAEHQIASAEEMIQILDKDMGKLVKQLEEIRIEVQNKNQIISDQAKEIEMANATMAEKLTSEKRRLKNAMECRLAAKQAEIKRKMCFDKDKFRQLKDILNSDDWTNLDDFNLDVGLSTETSSLRSETVSDILSKITVHENHLSSKKKLNSRKNLKSSNVESIPDLPIVLKSKKSSQLDKPNLDLQKDIASSITMQSVPCHKQNRRNSSRTSVKKFLTRQQSSTVDPQPVRNNRLSSGSFGQRVFGCFTRGSQLNSKRKTNLNDSDCIWIEHRPMGNLYSNDPPFFSKRTVSTLSLKDVTKAKASHYVLQHQEIRNGAMAVELYKAEIIRSVGGGAQVVFKDVVKMSKNLPRNYQIRKLDNESIPLKDVAERCTIAIECRGAALNVKKKK